MLKKWINILFSCLFVCMITVPVLLLNTEGELQSELENRAMTKWPGWGFNSEINAWYEHYAEDRVGFRETAIQIYNKSVLALFGEFSEELHMYGKNGYIFPADKEYIRAYQHLNTDRELIDSFITYLDNTNQYLQQKGITFVCTVGMDKKTVYPEYLPDYILVNEEEPGILEYLAGGLEETGVPYVIPVEEFRQAAKTSQIYNVEFDSAHWNMRGALLGMQLVNDKIWESKPDIPELLAEDFAYHEELRTGLEFAGVAIEELVPVYTPLEENASMSDGKLVLELPRVPGTSFQHYYTENAKSDQSILVFHDSFLENDSLFFTDIYREVYMVSKQNYQNMQFYVNLLEPDVVLFEIAERSFVDDLYAYTELAKVTYEQPYEAAALPEGSDNPSLQVSFSEISGGSLEEDGLHVDTEQTFLSLRGTFAAENGIIPEDYRIYVKYNGMVYEAGYAPHFPAHEELGGDFYISFRNKKMAGGTLEFFAVEKATGQEYSITTLKVV